MIENHFERVADRKVDMSRDYLVPFFHSVANTVRSVRPDWLVFLETDPFDGMRHDLPDGCPERAVNANHWYDISALVTKKFSTASHTHVLTGQIQEGAEAIQRGYEKELSRLKAFGDALNGGSPTLLGECGIQYDMNNAEAYTRWYAGERDPAVWDAQTNALDLMYNAIDKLLLSSTQWNYTVSNRNDPMIGDSWNQEDLSIWSIDQVDDPHDPDTGGRAVDGFCRPYVQATQGTLVSQRFDRQAGVFEAVIEADPAVTQPTVIYLPRRQIAEDRTVQAPNWSILTTRDQRLILQSFAPGRTTIRVTQQ